MPKNVFNSLNSECICLFVWFVELFGGIQQHVLFTLGRNKYVMVSTVHGWRTFLHLYWRPTIKCIPIYILAAIKMVRNGLISYFMRAVIGLCDLL